MSLNAFLEPVRPDAGRVTLPGAAQWMQGRTLYGGASALLAYTAATRAFPQLPPLRAAQVGFVAPVGETVEARVTMLREGRNRQVRRMTAAVGLPTLRLVRVAVGPVALDALRPGEWTEVAAPV